MTVQARLSNLVGTYIVSFLMGRLIFSVASDSDSGDVILTRTEPGDVIFTGSEEPMDVMITNGTSSKLI